MAKQSQKSMGGHFRVKITEPKQAMIGVALITAIAFGMKYLLFDSNNRMSVRTQGTHAGGKSDGSTPAPSSSYAITGASWATDEDMVDGVVSPVGGANPKPKAQDLDIDPEEARRMKEAAEKWQGLDIAVRDH